MAQQDYDGFQVLMFKSSSVKIASNTYGRSWMTTYLLMSMCYIFTVKNLEGPKITVFNLWTAEPVNRIYDKAMVLPVFDYRETVWYGSGKN